MVSSFAIASSAICCQQDLSFVWGHAGLCCDGRTFLELLLQQADHRVLGLELVLQGATHPTKTSAKTRADKSRPAGGEFCGCQRQYALAVWQWSGLVLSERTVIATENVSS